MSGRHTRIGEDVSYYPRHLAICELKGTYALPAMHIWRETDLTKMVNVTTRADRDTAFVEFNRNFAVSVDTTDHPLLEPHLLELINAEVNRDYVYHFEGDLLVIISQRADTDVVAFAAHASDVFGAVPPYLYQ